MAHVDAAFMQQVFDIPERKREAYVHHHGEPDDLGAGLEVAEGRAFGHALTLRKPPARLKPRSSDSTCIGSIPLTRRTQRRTFQVQLAVTRLQTLLKALRKRVLEPHLVMRARILCADDGTSIQPLTPPRPIEMDRPKRWLMPLDVFERNSLDGRHGLVRLVSNRSSF